MRIFGFNIKRGEKRAVNQSLESYALFGNYNNSASGIQVTPQSAMTSSAVYACVRVLAETIASLPLFLYKRLPEGGKEKDPSHSLFYILHDQPNEYQTSFEFREMLMGHLALRGNAYAQIMFKGDGKIEALTPLHPDYIKMIRLPDGRFFYQYRVPNVNKQINLRYDEVLHLKGLSSDGWEGISPIDTLRNAVGLTLAADEHGARFFSNNAQPGGILKYPHKLQHKELDNLRASWEKVHAGPKNASKIAILENGMEWISIGMNNEQAQFLETRQFQVTEIARIFRVPPHMIADLSKSSFSNIEQQSIDFVTNTVTPWVVRWEQAIKKTLLTDKEKPVYLAEFLIQGLLRGDSKARAEYFQLARTNGWLNVDEIREIENMNPLPDGKGKIYIQPMNMQEVGAEPEKDAPEDPKVSDEETETKSFDLKYVRSSSVLMFADIYARLLNKENKALETAKRKDELVTWAAKFYPHHKSVLADSLRSAISVFAAHVYSSLGMKPVGDDPTSMIEDLLDRAVLDYMKNPRRSATELGEMLVRDIEDRVRSVTGKLIEPITLPSKPKQTIKDVEVLRDETGRMIGARIKETTL